MVHGVQTMLTRYWQERMSAKVGAVELPRGYLAVDLEKLSASCERNVDGLIGADFFRRRVVQIDFDAQKIRLVLPPVQSLLPMGFAAILGGCGRGHPEERRRARRLMEG